MPIQVEIIADKITGKRFTRLGGKVCFYTSKVVALKPDNLSDINESEIIIMYPEDLEINFKIEKIHT